MTLNNLSVDLNFKNNILENAQINSLPVNNALISSSYKFQPMSNTTENVRNQSLKTNNDKDYLPISALFLTLATFGIMSYRGKASTKTAANEFEKSFNKKEAKIGEKIKTYFKKTFSSLKKEVKDLNLKVKNFIIEQKTAKKNDNLSKDAEIKIKTGKTGNPVSKTEIKTKPKNTEHPKVAKIVEENTQEKGVVKNIETNSSQKKAQKSILRPKILPQNEVEQAFLRLGFVAPKEVTTVKNLQKYDIGIYEVYKGGGGLTQGGKGSIAFLESISDIRLPFIDNKVRLYYSEKYNTSVLHFNGGDSAMRAGGGLSIFIKGNISNNDCQSLLNAIKEKGLITYIPETHSFRLSNYVGCSYHCKENNAKVVENFQQFIINFFNKK